MLIGWMCGVVDFESFDPAPLNAPNSCRAKHRSRFDVVGIHEKSFHGGLRKDKTRADVPWKRCCSKSDHDAKNVGQSACLRCGAVKSLPWGLGLARLF